MQPRAVGMTVCHSEIEHTLQAMADVLRNAAYTVAKERYPVGHSKHAEFFDEVGTLQVMDEISIKALLKDAIEHYLQFHAVARNCNPNEFVYYLNDSFEMVSEHINKHPEILSYLSATFASMCGTLAATLSPVIEDLTKTGHGIDRVESYVLNKKESYYLVVGEDLDLVETYDPKDDDLSTVDTYQSPEVLAGIAERTQMREVNSQIKLTIDTGQWRDNRFFQREIKAIPFHPYIDINTLPKLDTSSTDKLLGFF